MEAVAEITTEVKNVPALRFPEFEGEWDDSKLDKLVDFKSGGTPSMKHPEYWNGRIPWISASSMVGKYYSQSDRTITELGLANGSRLAPKGSLLLLVRGSMLFNKVPVGIAGVDVSFNQDVKALVTQEGADTEFIYQWFSAKQNQLLNIVTGTGIGAGKLDTDELKNIKVHLPSISEQQKIASFLSAVDDKIRQLSKKKEMLEKYKKGVMQQLFSQQIRFKDDNGNGFPEWEEKELREVAKRVTLKNRKNDINFVLTNSATQGIVSQQDYFDKDIANQENLEGYYVVDVNDFVYNPRISTAAPVGPIKRNKLAKGVMSPLYTVFRFEKQNLKFLEFFFETTVWHRYMKSVANYGARHDRMSITNDDLLRLPIPVPCKAEQEKIAVFLSAVENKLYYTITQLEQAQQFKKGLLQQLFV